MKKITYFVACASVLLIVVFVIEHFSYGFFTRINLKHQCGAGMDCACFANVVDNRLTRNQVSAFSKMLDSAKVRQNTNILEFTDENTARQISEIVSICRTDEK